MATRFRAPRYRDDAVTAYRMLVAEYPSSSLGDAALWSAVELARDGGDRRRLADAAQAYLDAYPEGAHATSVKKLLRQREPATPLPSPPPRGLARVFDLRSWSGESSTRVGGKNGDGYKPAGYRFLDGNRHRGHPAQDIFIKDRDQDGIDDLTAKPVDVLPWPRALFSPFSPTGRRRISPARSGEAITCGSIIRP